MPQPLSLFIPGRLCLAGEHSDWAASYRTQDPAISPGAALVLGLQQGLHATATRVPSSTLFLSSPLALPVSLPPDLLLPTAQSSSPWRFAAGVAYLIRQRYNTTGLSLDITHATLPAEKGLSSSAAVCVLLARAFNRVYHLGLSVAGEMDVAYAGERITGSACGRMDQIVAIGPGRVARMHFDGGLVEHCVIPVNATTPIHVVLADLGKRKDTCAILAGLNRAYASSDSSEAQRLRRVLGKDNLALIEQMEGALKDGDARELGRLLSHAQTLFDTAAVSFCPEELTAPVLHAILKDRDILPLVHGGKGVGSQGDGAVQFVARDRHSALTLAELLKQKLGTDPYIIQIGTQTHNLDINGVAIESPTTPACDRATVDTAVIPVAGFGTRLFPASRSIRPKALFPVVDTDGFVKPLLLHLVEQCANTGMKRVVVVVAPGEQEERVLEMFQPVPADLYKALKPHMQAYADRIVELGSIVEIAIQREPNGFGDAVACAGIEEDRPFALLLGDVVFKWAKGEKSCLHQTIDAFEEDTSRGVIGVTEMSMTEAEVYGVVRLATEDWGRKSRVAIQEVVEKPNFEKAAELSREGKCRVVVGPYIFTPALLRELRKDVKADKREKGEIQLTSAMMTVLGTEGLDCLCLNGEALDTGNGVGYVRTIWRLWGG